MSLNARHASRHPIKRPRFVRRRKRLTAEDLANMLRDIQAHSRDGKDGKPS